ncbi:hypothetical protein [Deinococcus cellulosilyticus]|uniref:Uncharacterized protein n=1 Tax=Deinococcus cellulosilyticus (strain DSM 18568 / NBRC 106333 / KACC 11606 / 5516J-15) TaxID=1223518 RepID=A0A511MZD0_DEIC1|nr:hypothetical protein [Deinococcus cellulosilyticus]GEM45892.1 hypothetical protein DC3_15270 [Deinococcus cellulosilyticus NBRC 106333 = KACC 11606]
MTFEHWYCNRISRLTLLPNEEGGFTIHVEEFVVVDGQEVRSQAKQSFTKEQWAKFKTFVMVGT